VGIARGGRCLAQSARGHTRVSTSAIHFPEVHMNLTIRGHHLDITTAMREYVQAKVARIKRHFDHVIDISVTLTVEKLNQKAEITLHIRGKDVHCEAIDNDMYAAIDLVTDKLDRQVLRHKTKLQNHGHVPMKRVAPPEVVISVQ
jgi:putative sigma-54 modulation protein